MTVGKRDSMGAAPTALGRTLAAVTVLLALATFAPSQAAAVPASDGAQQIRALPEDLPVRPEATRGNSRERFDDWTTRGGCHTRQWMLIDEARGGVGVKVSAQGSV